ncbi:MAG: hypothetical protein LBR52_06645 [Prevotellaceae bacterium]|jgi:hypothetical protein|nr:hypothetical protein [Prevotellaceae bacterium]
MKQAMIKIQILLLLTIAMTGCEMFGHWPVDDDNAPVVVYRTNNDYSQNVRVTISSGKVSSDVWWHYNVTLINGYYAEMINVSTNIAYLSFIISEIEERRNNGEREFTREELEQYIIDSDPFIDYYEEKSDYYGQFKLKNGIIDVAKLNNIIENGELEKYFYKVK